MATTTNFGWTTPDDTSLVKDGAAAIRTLGQSIDTSMMDLEGGTTGQVLSKASNTDMDFTWVTTDDTNAIQNAIVDAKGDLIGATAADTPARLAVGTNGQVLTADSTAATGLAWANASSALNLIGTTTLSSSSSFNITSVFSATYDNYLVIGSNLIGSTASYFTFGLRTGATNSTASYYSSKFGYSYAGSNLSGGSTTGTSISLVDYTTGAANAAGFSCLISNPFTASATTCVTNFAAFNQGETRTTMHQVATSYDSLWFTLNSGTISGKVSVYGFSK